MIKVVKKGYRPETGTLVYIGRGSPLGNPFRMGASSQVERDRVCDLYIPWIQGKIQAKDKEVCGALNHIYTLAKKGDVYLECFCAPLRCHGDTVKEIVDSAISLSGCGSTPSRERKD